MDGGNGIFLLQSWGRGDNCIVGRPMASRAGYAREIRGTKDADEEEVAAPEAPVPGGGGCGVGGGGIGALVCLPAGDGAAGGVAAVGAAALFNVAGDYGTGMGHARDGKLVFTGGSAEDGRPGVDPVTGIPLHQAHQGGANIDLRYMGSNGQSLIGNDAAATGHVNRNRSIINLFFNAGANLGAALTGDPRRYGLAPLSPRLQRIHRNHMHFQMRYPAVR